MSAEHFINKLVERVNGHPTARYVMLNVISESRREYRNLMIHGKAQDHHVAHNLRRFYTLVALDVIPFKDQVARGLYLRELADLKECPDWEHIKYWLPLAEAYSEEQAEEQSRECYWSRPESDYMAEYLRDCCPGTH